MKLKQVLEIQEVLDGTKRATPIDMEEKWVYYSDSREEWVDIMEIDVIHAIRILRKYVGQGGHHIKELESLQEIT